MSGRCSLAGGLMLLVVATNADAQTALVGTTLSPPVRHGASKTPPHPAAAHGAPAHGATHAGANTAVKPRHVPVIAPRHAGPMRQGSAASARKPVLKLVKKEVPAAKPAAPSKPVVPPPPADVGTVTGFHIPRYAALKSDDVNMRVGPAERYPVTWTYKRRELPVRIEREFDAWRLVEDMDGVKGWVLAAMLTGRRTFVVTGDVDRTLRADASETAEAVATLKPGVVGRIKACDAAKDWCQVQVQDYRGWLPRTEVWGVDAGEAVAP